MTVVITYQNDFMTHTRNQCRAIYTKDIVLFIMNPLA